jgi:Domain of unknown function (DUF6798)
MAAAHEKSSPGRDSVWLAAIEIVWIFLILFLLAGSPPPDVGESHYLAKAKHYWQPAWCAGDLFLESKDAHGTFYWTFGWVTRLCSLTATAWIGRAITWALLAWSWRRLSWAVVPRPLASLLSVGLMLLLLRNFHLAGEWIVGGIEAKGFAYVLVFLALESIARNRWRAALLLAGAAGAFHVLVGGWTAVAIGLAWLWPARDRPRLATLVPAAAGGLVLALPGLVPAIALNWGVEKDVAREAARIYVFERLAHHLVYHLFAPANITRFQFLVAFWAWLCWLMRNELALRRVQQVVAGAVLIGVIGVIIDQATVLNANLEQRTALEYQLRAARFLRYYWFRMSDSLVPIGAALAIVAGLVRLHATRPALGSWLIAAAILAASINLADVCYWRSLQRLPLAIMQPKPTADSWPRSWFQSSEHQERGNVKAVDWYRHWRAACEWIAENSPSDAMFLTPREQQTFKWYAGRAEVLDWKDVPQDARGLIEWKKRLDEVYPRDQAHRQHDLAAFTDEELIALAQKYGAAYIVIDRTRATRRIGLARLYPGTREENPSFEVYRAQNPRRQ